MYYNIIQALVIPGGFGAAKNFSDFAFKGENFNVRSDVEKIIKDFYSNQKYIAACCISPVLLARVLGKKYNGPGLTMTLGKVGVDYFKLGKLAL